MSIDLSRADEKNATLTRSAHCHFCGALIQAGAAVLWYERSGIRGGTRVRGVSARHVPCCHGDFPGQCASKERDAERMRREQRANDLVGELTALLQSGDFEAALAKATGETA